MMKLQHTHAQVAVVLVESHKVHGGHISCRHQVAASLERAITGSLGPPFAWITAVLPRYDRRRVLPGERVRCGESDMCMCASRRELGLVHERLQMRLVMDVRLMNA
jgi:hypothetical protein